MKLKTLLKGLPVHAVKGSQSITINGICSNSKKVKPGDLFIARKGTNVDGSDFIPSAMLAGAVAVVTDMYNPFHQNIVQVIVKDVNAFEPLLAARFYKYPSRQLFTVGVTGTNGKSTNSFLIRYLFEALHGPCGYIGTLGTMIREHFFLSELTTPNSASLQNLLFEMHEKKCSSAVMEVSSHALDQGRVDEIDFDLCVYTNLSCDHLDYHPSMDHYAKTKASLFTKQIPAADQKGRRKWAILNADDPYFSLMKEHSAGSVLSYGLHEADVRAENIELSSKKTRFELCYEAQRATVQSGLIGRFNLYNLLAAAASGIAAGFEIGRVAEVLSQQIEIPGRLQKVPNELGLDLFVDFAHTPDALEKVLETAQEIKRNRLVVVFGCGGGRDRKKRPLMLASAYEKADQVIVTTDNPRFEDPEQIVEDMFNGKDYQGVSVQLDRRQAITEAIHSSEEGDLILIAGKGHESEQLFQNKAIEFDDYFVAKEICLHYGKAPLIER